MCTCIDIKGINHYFGRTLDLDFHYNEEAVITPRNYNLNLANGDVIKTKYALIGTAMVINGTPMYYEAVNEKGLAIAGLNFPYNCHLNDYQDGSLNLAISDIIPYFLSKYETISDLRMDLEALNIINIEANGYLPTPLHFLVSDSIECIVIEQTKNGLNVYENNVGVMTNNPPFNLQIKNLNKYESLNNSYIEPDNMVYSCVGLGSSGLPGGVSSADRFVKSAFMVKFAKLTKSEYENVSTFFHILDSVSMVDNCCISKTGKVDLSYYTSCINVSKGIYYYKTLNSSRIKELCLNEDNMNDDILTRFPLSYEFDIEKLN